MIYMSKRKKIIIATIVFIVLLIGAIWLIPKSSNGYTIIKNGYSSYKSKIISNYQEYQEFADYIDRQNVAYGKVYNFNSNKYNKNYFNNKSLAIINIVTGNGSNILKNIDISIVDNTLVCKPKVDYGDGITADINGKLILIEIDKSVTNFKIEY